MAAGGSISTVTSRWSLSRLPASTAVSSRPQIRMTPLLSSCDERHGRRGFGRHRKQRRHFGPDRAASLDHPDPVKSAIALTVTCS